ncbi:flavin reductase family protein [Streptomyces sp. M10(2022)]
MQRLLDPPVLLTCVRSGSPTLDAVLQFGGFAVNMLHEDARTTSELFSSGAPDRFDRVRWQSAVDSGLPHLVDQAHTIADCEIRQSETVGDHTVVFGGVRRVRHLTSARPSRWSTDCAGTRGGRLGDGAATRCH